MATSRIEWGSRSCSSTACSSSALLLIASAPCWLAERCSRREIADSALAPDGARAYINRGYAYSLLGDWDQALVDADAALDRDTLSAIAWGNRADANGHLGNVEQALDDFDQALFIDPTYATAYLDRGLLFERLGRAAEAVEDFKRYLDLAPNAADRAEIQAKVDALE